MNRPARAIAVLMLLALAAPELHRYRAEWLLVGASARIERVLRGIDRGDEARREVRAAERLARDAQALRPLDARAALLRAIAALLDGRAGEAASVLESAITHGERPELTLNLGRARTALGDADGANAAYLRTAWASPLALATLPRAMRDTLLDAATRHEQALRTGRVSGPPPLR